MATGNGSPLAPQCLTYAGQKHKFIEWRKKGESSFSPFLNHAELILESFLPTTGQFFPSFRSQFKAASSRKPALTAKTPITSCTLLHYMLSLCIMLSVVMADLSPCLHRHALKLLWAETECSINVYWILGVLWYLNNIWYLTSPVLPTFYLLRSHPCFWPRLWWFLWHNTTFIYLFSKDKKEWEF